MKKIKKNIHSDSREIWVNMIYDSKAEHHLGQLLHNCCNVYTMIYTDHILSGAWNLHTEVGGKNGKISWYIK